MAGYPTVPQVSIIIPAHNAQDVLARAIESALAQTFSDFELLIVDDGSTDQTVRVAEQYLSDPRVRLMRRLHASGGPGAPRNQALEYATGDWVALLDADDEWLPQKIEKQYSEALRSGADVVYTRTWIKSETRQRDFHGHGSPPTGVVTAELIEFNFVPCLTAFFRRELVNRCGHFDVRHTGAEDWDLWLRFALGGATFGFVDEQLAVYHLHSSNMSKSLEWNRLQGIMFARLALTTSHHRSVLAQRSLHFFTRWMRERCLP